VTAREIDIIIARGKCFIIIKFYSKIAYLFERTNDI